MVASSRSINLPRTVIVSGDLILSIDGMAIAKLCPIVMCPEKDAADYEEPYCSLHTFTGHYLGYRAPTEKDLIHLVKELDSAALDKLKTEAISQYYTESNVLMLRTGIDPNGRFGYLANDGKSWYTSYTQPLTFSRKRLKSLLSDASFIDFVVVCKEHVMLYDIGTMKPIETLTFMLKEAANLAEACDTIPEDLC